jgi:hypothetical protein
VRDRWQGHTVGIPIGVSAEALNPLTIVVNVPLHGTTFPVVSIRNIPSMRDSIHVPDSVRKIEQRAFDEWSNLSLIKISENSDLFSFAVPGNITEIRIDCLLGCRELVHFIFGVIPDSNCLMEFPIPAFNLRPYLPDYESFVAALLLIAYF